MFLDSALAIAFASSLLDIYTRYLNTSIEAPIGYVGTLCLEVSSYLDKLPTGYDLMLTTPPL